MRFVVPMNVAASELVFPVGARTMPPGREVKRKNPILYLPSWVSGKTQMVADRVGGFEKPATVTIHPDPDDPDQMPTTIIAAGTEHQEDLLEMGEKIREEARATKNERRVDKKARVKAKVQQYADHLDDKITTMKRSHRTMPDPQHSRDTERKLF